MSSPASNPLRLDFILNSSRPSSPPALKRDEPFSLSVEPSRTLGPIRPATHHDVMTGSPRVAEWSVPRRHSDYPRPYSHHAHSRAAPYPVPVHLSASQSQVIDNHAYTSIHPSIIDGNPGGREGISRATKACNACRDSKVRCNYGPGLKACERCAKAGRKCVWSTTQRKRGPAPGTLNPNRPTTAARRNRRSNASASASGSVSTVTPSPPMPCRSLAPLSDTERERERVGTIRTTPPFTVPELGLALHRASVESAASARLLTPEHESRRSSKGGFGGRLTLAPPSPSLRAEGSSPAHRPSLHHQQQDRRSSYQGWQPPVKRAEPVPAPARTYFPADYSVRHTYTDIDTENESAGQKPRQTLPPISALLERPPPPYSPRHQPAPPPPTPPVIATTRRSSLFGSDGRSMPPSSSSASTAGRRSFWNNAPLQPTSRPAFYA